jgi:hypothetical protein
MKNNPNNTRQCPGCKAIFPRNDDLPKHIYGVISPECWAAFCRMLAYESEHLGYPPEHRLIVDACGVQHPQNFELQKQLEIEDRLVRASVQSVGRHLIGLYCAIEKKIELPTISKVMAHIIEHGDKLELLNPPANRGSITTADFSPNFTPEEYKKFAWNWAHSVWDAWAPYHDTVRGWVKKYAPHVK